MAAAFAPPFDVRKVVASTTGDRVLLGAFDHDVAVLDIASGCVSAPFG